MGRVKICYIIFYKCPVSGTFHVYTSNISFSFCFCKLQPIFRILLLIIISNALFTLVVSWHCCPTLHWTFWTRKLANFGWTFPITHNICQNSQTVASPLRLELFHYIQKVIVDLRLVAKLQFHLVQVGQSIFYLRDREESQFHQSTNMFFCLLHSFLAAVSGFWLDTKHYYGKRTRHQQPLTHDGIVKSCHRGLNRAYIRS